MIVPKHYEDLNIVHENTMPYRAYYPGVPRYGRIGRRPIFFGPHDGAEWEMAVSVLQQYL